MGIQQVLLAGGVSSSSNAIVTLSGSFYDVSSWSPAAPRFPKAPNDSPLTGTSGVVTGADFSMQADGGYAGGQNGGFTTLNVQVTGGGIRIYTPGTATWNAGLLTWTWGTGASPVWTAPGTYLWYFT